MSAPEMPERIWYHSDGAYLPYQPTMHWEWQEFVRSDLCASGQQVRALEWEQVDPTAVLGHGIEPCQYYIRYEVGFWWMPGDAEVEDAQEFDDLEAAKAAAQVDYERRILAALTPAPQPEATENYADPDSSAPQPAQEAVPVAWRYRYVDPVSGKPIWRYSNNLWNGQRPSESQPLYAHPPQPSETVAAKALEELLGFARALEKQSSKGTGGRRGGAIFARADAALRALKGENDG